MPESAATGCVAAVGTFDGVHAGHRALIDDVCRIAAREHLEAAVVTFSRHPLTVLRPQRVPSSLAVAPLKERLLAEAGITRVIRLDFTPQLAALTAEEFMRILHERYGVRHLVIGFNTSMGSDRLTDLHEFQRAGGRVGMKVSQASEFKLDGFEGTVCSTAVRHLVTAGDVDAAARLLLRPYELRGRVVHGRQLGRTIGFPTANLEPEPARQSIPAPGVYACRADAEGIGTFDAIVNIGSRPTVESDGALTIEAHLLDADADLYGGIVTLSFRKRLRDERRFDSLDALRTQLAADADAARRALAGEE